MEVNVKSDYRVLGATIAGSKRAAPGEELRSYLGRGFLLLHLTSFCMLLAMWVSIVSNTLMMTNRSS
jgi:hypothetical protein